MGRLFNTSGPCNPDDHFMLPTEPRLPEVRELIEEKHYFVVHAPRQSGKTTLFQALARKLTAEGKYAALHVSCERGQVARSDIDRGVQAVLQVIVEESELLTDELRPEPIESFLSIGGESRLGVYLKRWCRRAERPVVLFLDEIDSLIDDTLISVLRQLREGYPAHKSATRIAMNRLPETRHPNRSRTYYVLFQASRPSTRLWRPSEIEAGARERTTKLNIPECRRTSPRMLETH